MKDRRRRLSLGRAVAGRSGGERLGATSLLLRAGRQQADAGANISGGGTDPAGACGAVAVIRQLRQWIPPNRPRVSRARGEWRGQVVNWVRHHPHHGSVTDSPHRRRHPDQQDPAQVQYRYRA